MKNNEDKSLKSGKIELKKSKLIIPGNKFTIILISVILNFFTKYFGLYLRILNILIYIKRFHPIEGKGRKKSR